MVTVDAEEGLPVGFTMLSLAIWAVRPAMRTIWGIGVIAVLIHAGFDYPFSRPAVGAWPILMLSMAAASRGRRINFYRLYAGLTVDTFRHQAQSHPDYSSSRQGHDE